MLNLCPNPYNYVCGGIPDEALGLNSCEVEMYVVQRNLSRYKG